jgi:hypothetical protein
LRQILTSRFDAGELRTLCFDLGVDYDSLLGEGKANKARELIAYVERRDLIPELVRAGRRLRLDIPWDDIPEASQTISSTPRSASAEPLHGQSGGVTIGNVSGGIHGSIIASGDVSGATITFDEQPALADREPTVAELKQLLVEIQQGLVEITTQRDALKEISSAAPFDALGAEQRLKDVIEEMEGTGKVKPEEAESVQRSLTQAAGLLGGILDGAKAVAQKTAEIDNVVQPLVEELAPLVEKLGLVALWAAKLWPKG